MLSQSSSRPLHCSTLGVQLAGGFADDALPAPCIAPPSAAPCIAPPSAAPCIPPPSAACPGPPPPPRGAGLAPIPLGPGGRVGVPHRAGPVAAIAAAGRARPSRRVG